jgi:hypothetical protein
MGIRTRIATTAVGLAAAAGFAATFPETATAAPTVADPTGSTAPAAVSGTCDGAACNGQDPQSTGCAADAITADSVVEKGVTLELRYSPSCHANWARIVPGQFGWHFTVTNANGDQQSARAWGGATAYTNMVNGYPAAQACFDNGVCTRWV